MSTALRRGPVALCVGAAAALVVGCSSGGPHSASSPSTSIPDTYGGMPSFLPKSALRPDSMLIGTVTKPALTVEGDTVKVTLPGGSVIAEVSGPVVPGEGLPYVTETTTCTWRVKLSHATTTVPIRTSDFTSIDHLGNVFHMAFVPGARRPPATLSPGQHASFELRAVMPTGEGLMRWTPTGHATIASWDFVVEND